MREDMLEPGEKGIKAYVPDEGKVFEVIFPAGDTIEGTRIHTNRGEIIGDMERGGDFDGSLHLKKGHDLSILATYALREVVPKAKRHNEVSSVPESLNA